MTKWRFSHRVLLTAAVIGGLALLAQVSPATASELEDGVPVDVVDVVDGGVELPGEVADPPGGESPVVTEPSSDPTDTGEDRAAAARMGFGTITQLKVVNSSKTTNYVDKSRQLARCNVETTGLSCSINRTASATRTVNVAFGMSRDAISAQLGFSSADTVSVGVTCNSGPLKKGQSLVAYSVGSQHKYQVNKIVARNGVVLSNETSGWLYAFNPYSAGISCKVV